MASLDVSSLPRGTSRAFSLPAALQSTTSYLRLVLGGRTYWVSYRASQQPYEQVWDNSVGTRCGEVSRCEEGTEGLLGQKQGVAGAI